MYSVGPTPSEERGPSIGHSASHSCRAHERPTAPLHNQRNFALDLQGFLAVFTPPPTHSWNLVLFQGFVYIKEVALNAKLCRPCSLACCNNIIFAAGKGYVPQCTATKTLLGTAVFQASVAFHLLWESNPKRNGAVDKRGASATFRALIQGFARLKTQAVLL